MKNTIYSGPFEYEPLERATINGIRSQNWRMSYGSKMLTEQFLPEATIAGQIIEAFDAARANFERKAKAQAAPDLAHLIDSDTDTIVASIATNSACGMTAGIVDDRSKFWLRSDDRILSRPITIQGFADLAAAQKSAANVWIADLLPGDVRTIHPCDWRAPTVWEIRHVVGEGSFTGVSGAYAAALAGVTPQNFRKYTARSDSRQLMSYAMWHLLLHKLGVQILG